MRLTPSAVLDLIHSPAGKKLIRYSATSVICVILSSSILAVLVGILHWGAFSAAVTACAITTVPSYMLNRRWAWGKTGRGHLMKEVAPFWIMAFIGLAFSTWTSVLAQSYADHHHLSNLVRTALVDGAFIGAFGVLWVGKFLIINKYLFAHHPDEQTAAQATTTRDAAALDASTGVVAG